MELPRLVYKDGGPHERAHGTYSYAQVKTADEHAAMLADGWYDNLGDALAPKPVPVFEELVGLVIVDPAPKQLAEYEDESLEAIDVSIDEVSPPTRSEMEAKAKQMNIKAYWKMSDEKLLEKIGGG